MAVDILDILKANVVIVGIRLLGSQNEVESFSRGAKTEVLAAGTGIVVGPSTTAQDSTQNFRLNRDRISLELSRLRSTIEQEYPVSDDLSRLAEVAGLAVEETDLNDQIPSAFGYNVEFVYEQHSAPSAAQYLAERLFNTQLPNSDSWVLDRGTAQLGFMEKTTRWNITIEPRFRDNETSRVFVSINQHRDESRVPGQEEIASALGATLGQARAFIAQLDGMSR